MSTSSTWSARRTTSSGTVSRWRDAGDPLDDVVERLEVLHVHRGQHVDPGGEQLLDVLPALRVARARGVGVGELVDEHDLGRAGEHGVDVQLGQGDAAVHDRAAGQRLAGPRAGRRCGCGRGSRPARRRRPCRVRRAGAPRRAWRRSCRPRARRRGGSAARRGHSCRHPAPPPPRASATARFSRVTFTAGSPRNPRTRPCVASATPCSRSRAGSAAARRRLGLAPSAAGAKPGRGRERGVRPSGGEPCRQVPAPTGRPRRRAALSHRIARVSASSSRSARTVATGSRSASSNGVVRAHHHVVGADVLDQPGQQRRGEDRGVVVEPVDVRARRQRCGVRDLLALPAHVHPPAAATAGTRRRAPGTAGSGSARSPGRTPAGPPRSPSPWGSPPAGASSSRRGASGRARRWGAGTRTSRARRAAPRDRR